MRKFLIATTAGIALMAASMTATTASASDFNANPFGLFLGAAAGGLIGSQIGQGQGRIVATAAGTFIGAMIGANATSNSYRSSTYAYTPPRATYRSPTQVWANYGDHRDARGTTVYVDNRTYITNTTVTQTNVRHDTDYGRDRNRYTRWSRY